MKRLLSILIVLAIAGSASAQDKVIVLSQRPVADLVRSLGGELGHDPAVNNADIITAALADRTKDIIHMPPGIIEITEPIIWPARSGITLMGSGEGIDVGDSAFQGGSTGGTSTRIVAKFDTTEQAMIVYQGKQGRMSGFSLEGYPITGAWWNFITNATNATPIVCTTSSAHGLSDNDHIQIHGLSGNTNANGSFYVDVLSSTTFALYSASGPTTAVAGNGADTTPTDTAAPWRMFNRAQIGIHVQTQETTFLSTGKLDLRNVTFMDLPVGVLWGRNMDEAYAMADDYDGENDTCADESVIDHCTWRYPVSNGDPDERTCMYHRCIQSLGFTQTHCTVHGWVDECSYFERGGLAKMDWRVNGNATNVLRIGVGNYTTDFDLWADVDGGDDTWIGRHTKILSMDKQSAGVHITIGGNQRAAPTYVSVGAIDLPLFKVRGTAKLNIENFNGLIPDSVQAIGRRTGTTSQPALVTFRNCTTYGTANMSAVRTALGDADASVVPCIFRWYDCNQAFALDGSELLELRPLTDGQDITDDGLVTFGP